MTIKELFEKAEGGILTFEQFQEASKTSNAKFVDVNDTTHGGYVSKNKYDSDLASKDTEIENLNNTIKTRDEDLQKLKDKLTEAGTDAEKLANLTGEFDTLKAQYKEETKKYQDQLNQQAYEFAVKEFANGKKFTSNAAKRDFINSMITKKLKMENGNILGGDDFVELYSKDNSDAFVVDTPEPEPDAGIDSIEQPLPQFVNPTQGSNAPANDPTGGFANAFHFTGVRVMPQA